MKDAVSLNSRSETTQTSGTEPMSKNECGKTRDIKKPYEIWLGANGFEWRVLKKYQNKENEAKNPHARWMMATKSPFTFGSYEYGDTYVKEIKGNFSKVYDFELDDKIPTEYVDISGRAR